MNWLVVASVAVFAAILGTGGGYIWATLRKSSDGSSGGVNRVIGVMLMALAVASCAELVFFLNEQQRQLECQYRVNSALIQELNRPEPSRMPVVPNDCFKK